MILEDLPCAMGVPFSKLPARSIGGCFDASGQPQPQRLYACALHLLVLEDRSFPGTLRRPSPGPSPAQSFIRTGEIVMGRAFLSFCLVRINVGSLVNLRVLKSAFLSMSFQIRLRVPKMRPKNRSFVL